MSACLMDSDNDRRGAEHMAARLCTQVQELRTFGITAVVGRIAVSTEKCTCDSYPTRLNPCRVALDCGSLLLRIATSRSIDCLPFVVNHRLHVVRL